MLNGIGGCTIAEAKQRLTRKEAEEWARYISKRGSLNFGRRIDRGFAMLNTWLLRVNGMKADIEDFLPYSEKPEQPAGTIQDAFSLFKSLKPKSKKK